MVRRLQARLTYANVISTLALFGALGGGAIAAIQGNGHARFEAERGLPQSEMTTILTIPGTGRLLAYCESQAEGGQLEIHFQNTSEKKLAVFLGISQFGGGTVRSFEVPPQDNALLETPENSAGGDEPGQSEFHVFRVGDADAPMADLLVSAHRKNDCAQALIAVEALSTD